VHGGSTGARMFIGPDRVSTGGQTVYKISSVESTYAPLGGAARYGGSERLVSFGFMLRFGKLRDQVMP